MGSIAFDINHDLIPQGERTNPVLCKSEPLKSKEQANTYRNRK